MPHNSPARQALKGPAHADLLCHMQTETLANLSERQRELLREREALSPGRNNNPRAQPFIDKAKSILDQISAINTYGVERVSAPSEWCKVSGVMLKSDRS